MAYDKNDCIIDKMCYRKECLNMRGIFDSNNDAINFEYRHFEEILNAETCMNIYSVNSFTAKEIEEFTPDKLMQEDMKLHQDRHDTGLERLTVIKLGDSLYVTRGEVSSTKSTWYFHVAKKLNSDSTTTLKCKSQLSPCKSRFKRSKMASQRTLCVHLRYAILAIKKIEEKSLESRPSTSTTAMSIQQVSDLSTNEDDNPTTSNEKQQPTALAAKTTNINEDLQIMCLSRRSTMDIQMTRSLPYIIPPPVLLQLTVFDSLIVDSTNSNLPDQFMPISLTYLKCNDKLPGESVHQRGQSSKRSGILVTHNNPSKPVDILVKICKNKECLAINPAFPIEYGKLD